MKSIYFVLIVLLIHGFFFSGCRQIFGDSEPPDSIVQPPIEAAKIIKSRTQIPIIIFTGYNDKFIHDQVQSVRPAAVLSKMDPVSAIVAAIDKATISQSPIVKP